MKIINIPVGESNLLHILKRDSKIYRLIVKNDCIDRKLCSRKIIQKAKLVQYFALML